ncbi:MAG: ribonuclease Z [Bacteroidales bacterium]
MHEFELTILGCGSAKPSLIHRPSSQVLAYRGKLFMIDCGEGTQTQFMKYGFNHNRLAHIFISHLHGDHCFGLMGLISTLGLLGRSGELVIHSHSDLEEMLRPEIDYFCSHSPFSVIFSHIPPKPSIIYEDKSLFVKSFPLHHSIPTFGFRFEEKQKQPHINKSVAEYYNVPIKEMQAIKDGADFVTPQGDIIPNNRLVLPASPSVSYAYCSDTAYTKKVLPHVSGATVLFHESTYTKEYIKQAKARYHSTAAEAATVASEAGIGRLILGHYSSRYKDETPFLNEAIPIFSETILGNEGLKLEF